MTGPISVSVPGKSLLGSVGTDITFNTRYPFHKLDSTNENSFQVISIFFNTEPPNPSQPTSVSTTLKSLVYSYPHGYHYTPSSWFLISVNNFVNVLGSEGSYILGSSTSPVSSPVKFEIEVDDTNVNFYVDKTWTFAFGQAQSSPNIIGYTVSVRSYIFVEDLSATMVPSHS